MKVERGLYVVATPIGNLGDMVPRAVAILQSVSVIACEDTRHSSRLLQHFDITTPLMACHEHNEPAIAEQVCARIAAGEAVALISDAGTPLISDPGFRLVQQVRAAELPVIPVPGACAAIAALSVSGLASDRFVFEGFLAAKAGARDARLRQLQPEQRTLIFYEAPHRILATVTAMQEIFGAQRQAALARELTKLHETVWSGPLSELQEFIAADSNQQRGEIVLVVSGAPDVDEALSAEALRVLALLMPELGPSKAAGLTAKITGAKKKALYEIAVSEQRDA